MFGPYEEIVAREAFTDTLAAEPDVAFLVNHKGVTMARTTNGSLELAMVSDGLGMDAWVNPKRTDVKGPRHRDRRRPHRPDVVRVHARAGLVVGRLRRSKSPSCPSIGATCRR